MADAPRRFDPLGLLTSLDRHRVAYIVVGAFGRVVQGAEEITRGVDIVPSTKPDNLERLEAALEELEAAGRDRRALSRSTSDGEDERHRAFHEPRRAEDRSAAGGNGRLRRSPPRRDTEPLGKGVRPAVASVDDLARMLAALGREQDQEKLRDLRRLAELELSRGVEL